MTKPKFSLPPKVDPTVALPLPPAVNSIPPRFASVKEFGEAAEAKPEPADAPWAGKDDKSRRPAFNLRPTEVEKLMMDYVLKHTTYKSLHEMVMSIAMPEIKAKAEAIYARNRIK